MTPQEFAINQRREGKSAAQTAAGLKQTYQVSAQEAAKSLKAAGYAANEVADAMKTVFNLGADQVQTVLKTVGYAASEAAGGATPVSGEAKKSALGALDPRRW